MPGSAEPTTRAGRGRPSVERSAQITSEILAVATEMFLQDGYEATSIDAIARRVGIPKTTLYKRYRDKQALLRATIRERMRLLTLVAGRSELDIEPDLRSQLAHLVAGILLWANKPEVRAVNRLFAHLSNEPMDALPGEDFSGYRKMHRKLADVIETFGPAEGIHAHAPEKAARALMEFAGGAAFRLARQPTSPEDAEREARSIVDLMIGGARVW